MRKTILTLGVLVLLAGCGQDTEENGPVMPGAGQGEFFGTFAATPDVKTSMEYDEATQKVKISWAAEDRIGIFGSKEGTSLKDNAEYKAILSGGVPTGYFEAVDAAAPFPWGDGAGTRTFLAYYPYDAAAASGDALACTVPAAQQQTTGMAHVAAAGLMTAVGTSTSEQRETVQLQFRSAFAVAEFIVKQAAGENITLRSVKLKGAAPLAGAATCNLATGSLTAAAGASNEVTLTFGEAGLALDEAGKSIYFLVLPGVHAAGTVQLVFTDVNGKVFTKPLWGSTERTFKANVTTRQPIAALASSVLNEPDAVTAFDLSADLVTPSGTTGSALSLAPNGTQINDIDADNGEIVLTLQDNGTPMGSTAVNVPYNFNVASDEATVSVPASGTFEFASVKDVKTFTVTTPTLTRAEKIKTWKVRLVYMPQVPNSDLNTWGRDSGNKFDDPEYWSTANFYSNFLVKSTGATKAAGKSGQDGDNSALLTTQETFGQKASSSLFLGTFTFTSTSDASNPRKMTQFGIPFNASAKILGIEADVKYSTSGDDFGSVIVELVAPMAGHSVADYKYHGQGSDGSGPATDGYGSTADRVVWGTYYISNAAKTFNNIACDVVTAGEWKHVFIPIDYTTVPDPAYTHLNISCASSGQGDKLIGVKDSALGIDNIKIIYEE